MAASSQSVENSTCCAQPTVLWPASPRLNIIAANNQPVENSTVYNKPVVPSAMNTAAANIQPAENSTVNTRPSVRDIPLPPTRNVEPAGPPALNAVATNNQPVENGTVCTQPPANNLTLTLNTTISTPQATPIWNSLPVQNAVTANQMCNNMVLYSQPENTSSTNCQAPDNSLPYSQTATSVCPWQPTKNSGVCGQSVEGTLLSGYPSWWSGYPMYNHENTATGYGFTTTAEPYWTGGTPNLLMQPVDPFYFYTAGLYQEPAFDTTKDVSSSVCFSTDGKAQGNESHGRSTSDSKNSREPTKSKSHLCDKRDDVGIVAEPVKKKVRMEAKPDDVCQSNHQGPWQGKDSKICFRTSDTLLRPHLMTRINISIL